MYGIAVICCYLLLSSLSEGASSEASGPRPLLGLTKGRKHGMNPVVYIYIYILCIYIYNYVYTYRSAAGVVTDSSVFDDALVALLNYNFSNSNRSLA